MNSSLECIPCFLRQAVDILQRVSEDEKQRRAILQKLLRAMADVDLHQASPLLGQWLHQRLREELGNPDPYREIKQWATARAFAAMEDVRTRIQRSNTPLRTAVRFAIAGNILDFALLSPENDRLDEMLDLAENKTLDEPALAALEREIQKAKRILVLGDNAGETVFDRLLLEQLPGKHLTYAVKGGPIINDATLADALAAGLDTVAELIETGSNCPGTFLEQCSAQFLQVLARSDLILAKGQANLETLSDSRDLNIFFLTQIKCPVVAEFQKRKVGDWIVARPVNHNIGNLESKRDETMTTSVSTRVALPLADGALCLHFGHCEQFAIVDVDLAGKQIIQRQDLTPPPHEPGLLPRWLSEQGVTHVIAGGMGQRAVQLFQERGIEVMVGAPSDTPENLVTAWIGQSLQTGTNRCDH